jgi:hypothetical protein
VRKILILASVWAMALGYRTVELTQGLKVQPLEVLLWAYAMVASAQGKISFSAVPRWLGLFLLFTLVSTFSSSRPWTIVVSEFKAILILVPVFMLIKDAMQSADLLPKVFKAFIGVAFIISALGIFEYHLPGVARAIPFFGSPDSYYSYGAFYRANFSFFGNSIASFLPTMALAFYPYYKNQFSKLQFYGLNAILIYAVYIGGFRSFWAVAIASFLLNLYLQGQLKFLVLLLLALLVGGTVGLSFLPAAATARFLSAFSALSGDAELGENSGAHRVEMIKRVADWDTLTRHLFGHGLGEAGWVHSDILMIAYNSGLITAFLMAIFVLGAYWRLYRFTRKNPDFLFAKSLLATLPVILMIFIFQAFVVLPQLSVPLFFIMALVYFYPRYPYALADGNEEDDGIVENEEIVMHNAKPSYAAH